MLVSYNGLFKQLIDKGWNKTEFAREVQHARQALEKRARLARGTRAHLSEARLSTRRYRADRPARAAGRGRYRACDKAQR